MTSSSPPNNFSKRSLLYKILTPFVLIIIIFGGIGSYGIYRLFQDALTSTANQRLMTIQEVVFREIKKQELLLTTYANLVVFQYSTKRESQSAPYSLLDQDRFLGLLNNGNITASVYPARVDGEHGACDNLFRQANASGKARFSFSSTPDIPALLSVVVPLSRGGEAKELLLLQTSVDRTFLKQIVAPFSSDTAILDLNRKLLVTTAEDISLSALSDEQMTRLLNGEKILQTIKHNGYHRQLYSAIPVGSSEIVILAVDLPLTDLDLLMKTFATRAGLIIGLALLIGGFIFYRLICRITNLLTALLTATQEISNGNLDYRIEGKMAGELQPFAETFNQMNDKIAIVYRRKAKQEQKLAQLNEKLHYDQLQEEKNQEIAEGVKNFV
ncbi:MAG: hypothetical protein CVU69_13445 [Deltaproteobacteria bacterium HGW-Deltaproteobacteria-4]|nr:MAG: hypothetical protein CVU69_13445 [Deltaproteobacteria bacterium HGW-Deltaproteobacteria-4]